MNSTGKTVTLFGTEYQVADEHDGLITIQELKSFLPEMEDELYEQLKDDISLHGIHDPILYKELLDGGMLVIEGHTRLRAAIELGLTGEEEIPRDPVQEEYSSINDIKLWMLRHQFQRRNLSQAQKLRLAMANKETIEARATENLSKAGKGTKVEQKVHTADEIAKLAGVSRETAKRYMRVFETGDSDLLDELDRGMKTIHKASQQVKKEEKPSSTKPSPVIFDDKDKGMEMLKNGEIKALVIVNNKEMLKSFLPAQLSKFGFIIHND